MAELRATKRNALLGLLADAFTPVADYLSTSTNPVEDSGSDWSVTGLLGDTIKPFANTVNRMSYGEPLTTGKGMTTQLRPDTRDALLGVLPMGPPANSMLKAAKPLARDFVGTVGARNMSGMPQASRQIGAILPRDGLLNFLETKPSRVDKLDALQNYLMENGVSYGAANETAKGVVFDNWDVSRIDNLIKPKIIAQNAHPIKKTIQNQPGLLGLPPDEKEKKLKNLVVAWHTSPKEITKIDPNPIFGQFGENLFFSTSGPYAMGNVKKIYAREFDESEIIDVFDLEDPVGIKEIKNLLGIDDNDAYDVLTGRKSAMLDFGADADQDWSIQRIQGDSAKREGYQAARARDEQGTVLITPMAGKEKTLQEIGDMDWRDFEQKIYDKYR